MSLQGVLLLKHYTKLKQDTCLWKPFLIIYGTCWNSALQKGRMCQENSQHSLHTSISSPYLPLEAHLTILICRWFDRQSRNNAVHPRQEEELYNQRYEVPRQDEATAHHVWGQGHDLSHCQWGQDVGHLIYPPHGGIHSFCLDQTQRLNRVLPGRFHPYPNVKKKVFFLSTHSKYVMLKCKIKILIECSQCDKLPHQQGDLCCSQW